MKNIKDKQNKITVREANTTDLSMRNQSKNSYKLLAEKGQKIVTAIYMITDVLSETDPMFSLIRDKSVDAMKCLFRNLVEEGDNDSLEEAQHNLYELLSYLSIIHRIGSLSKMNYDVLFREIGLLQKSIKREKLNISKSIDKETEELSLPDIFSDFINKDIVVDDVISNVDNEETEDLSYINKEIKTEKKESFISGEQKFHLNEEEIISDNLDDSEKDIVAKEDFLRDSGEFFTEDELDLMSFNENLDFTGDEDVFEDDSEYIIDDDLTELEEESFDSSLNINGLSKLDDNRSENNFELKKDVKAERHEDILNILESKKDASITDICFFFEDCSSKTIQRDLKELIKDGKVTKQGDRRWAKYNLK